MSLAAYFIQKCFGKTQENIALLLAKLSDPKSLLKDSLSGSLVDAAKGGIGGLADLALEYVAENADGIILDALSKTKLGQDIFGALDAFYVMLSQAISMHNDLLLMFLKKVAQNIIVELEAKEKINIDMKEKLQMLLNMLDSYVKGDPVFDKYLAKLRKALVLIHSGTGDLTQVRNTIDAADIFLAAKLTEARGKFNEARELITPFHKEPAVPLNTFKITEIAKITPPPKKVTVKTFNEDGTDAEVYTYDSLEATFLVNQVWEKLRYEATVQGIHPLSQTLTLWSWESKIIFEAGAKIIWTTGSAQTAMVLDKVSSENLTVEVIGSSGVETIVELTGIGETHTGMSITTSLAAGAVVNSAVKIRKDGRIKVTSGTATTTVVAPASLAVAVKLDVVGGNVVEAVTYQNPDAAGDHSVKVEPKAVKPVAMVTKKSGKIDIYDSLEEALKQVGQNEKVSVKGKHLVESPIRIKKYVTFESAPGAFISSSYGGDGSFITIEEFTNVKSLEVRLTGGSDMKNAFHFVGNEAKVQGLKVVWSRPGKALKTLAKVNKGNIKINVTGSYEPVYGSVETAVEDKNEVKPNLLKSTAKQLGIPTEDDQFKNMLAIPKLTKNVLTSVKNYHLIVTKINFMLVGYYSGLNQLQTGLPGVMKKYVLGVFDRNIIKFEKLGGSMAIVLNGNADAKLAPVAGYKAQPLAVSVNALKWAFDINFHIASLQLIPVKGLADFELNQGAVRVYQGSVSTLKRLGNIGNGQTAIIAKEAQENTAIFSQQLLGLLLDIAGSLVTLQDRPATVSLVRSFIARCDLVLARDKQIKAALLVFINTPIPLEEKLKAIQEALVKALKALGLDKAADMLATGDFAKFFKLNSKSATYVGSALAAIALLKECFDNDQDKAKLTKIQRKVEKDKALLNIKLNLDFDLAILKNLKECLELDALALGFDAKEILCGLAEYIGLGKAFDKLNDLLSF